MKPAKIRLIWGLLSALLICPVKDQTLPWCAIQGTGDPDCPRNGPDTCYSNPCWLIPSRPCLVPECDLDCCNDMYRDPSWCDELLKDPSVDKFAWTKFFNGFNHDATPLSRFTWRKICQNHHPPNQNRPVYVIVQPENRILKQPPPPKRVDTEDWWDFYSNRLRFNASVIAQEGMSFCVIGSHLRRSSWAQWEPLKPFHPLLEKSLDIGNHIHPDDPTKMNRVPLRDPNKLREVYDKTGKILIGKTWGSDINPWHKDNNLVPTHRFESVWHGHLEINRDDEQTVGVEATYEFWNRPAHPEYAPDANCQNPYRVIVTLIEADHGIMLHNYLHITVIAEPVSSSGVNCPTGRIKFLMLEVRDQDGYPVGQFTDDVSCDITKPTTGPEYDCPASAKPCRRYYGTKKNQVPCMFSHPKAAVHPSIFMFSAEKEGGSSPSGPGATPQDPCRNNQIPKAQRPTLQYPKENKDQYVTEVHTTWRFAQMDHSWVSELHFATMIIEDETPIQYYTSRMSIWAGVSKGHAGSVAYQGYYWCSCPSIPVPVQCCGCYKPCCWVANEWNPPAYKSGRMVIGLINSCVNETYNTNRPYGYSAKYIPLKPTFNTMGGWDDFRRDYVDAQDVDCHKTIQFGDDEYYNVMDKNHPDTWGKLPLRRTLKEFLDDKYTLQNNPQKYQPPGEIQHYRPTGGYNTYTNIYELPDWHNPGMSLSTDGKQRWTAYYGLKPEVPILKMFDSAHQDPIVLKTEFDDRPFREYFGSRYGISYKDPKHASVEKLKGAPSPDSKEQTMTLEEQAMKTRCPCPYNPTTEPPEMATKPPVEIEGRRLHVVNMLLAWVVLVPISFFVARFYKETYSRVFFLQEFWWYSIHFLCLITALLFSIGGIYALYAKRQYGDPYEIVWTPATKVHIYMGYTVLGFYSVHLLLGAFRLYDFELRIIQICLHWLFGWLEYYFAAAVILAAIGIPSGIMNCVSFGIYCAFLGYQLAFTLGMEYHMRKVDWELNLDPPRTYLPPPMMRLFHRDAPHSKFRMWMLLLFSVGCFLFYLAMHISMRWEGAEMSCFQPGQENPDLSPDS